MFGDCVCKGFVQRVNLRLQFSGFLSSSLQRAFLLRNGGLQSIPIRGQFSLRCGKSLRIFLSGSQLGVQIFICIFYFLQIVDSRG